MSKEDGGAADGRFFIIRAMRVEDSEKAKVLEALCNRPDFVERVMDEVNKAAQREMERIIFGFPADAMLEARKR